MTPCFLAVIPAKVGIHLWLLHKSKMDSSLLKAEHIHVLSLRARFRGNDGLGTMGCFRWKGR
jgi:hypothetical protein